MSKSRHGFGRKFDDDLDDDLNDYHPSKKDRRVLRKNTKKSWDETIDDEEDVRLGMGVDLKFSR